MTDVLEKTTELITELSKHGSVEQCQLESGVFTLLITGEDLNTTKTSGAISRTVTAILGKGFTVRSSRIQSTFFFLTLKQN